MTDSAQREKTAFGGPYYLNNRIKTNIGMCKHLAVTLDMLDGIPLVHVSDIIRKTVLQYMYTTKVHISVCTRAV